MSESDYEKLGVFYLGRNYDLPSKKTTAELCLYDSKDLVTHAICIGMTGSGKTGLCLGLLEEAAIDSIPVIAIDPKGDIANVLLTFPQLRGEDFEPWVDPDEARRKGVSVSEFAGQQAELWRNGLAEWDESGTRIQRLKDAADFSIYTPGSTAGIPVSVVSSFSAPPDAVLEDTDSLRERISTTASSLLGLLSIDADPLKSREHILVSNILKVIWQQKKDLTLTSLIQLIQKPPLTQIGALDLETFYPSKERFELAMQLNNLLASPGFETWSQGEPLDISRILYTTDGRPRVSIFSIAHLGDSERMFFVSLLLNQLISWMRAQSGTSSLRAILYMDEIFGYFPPVSNPPSKTPLLTLLKQGRAFGLGTLLASQNPVDIDYKGLANAGTWFIGRLQTERDKMRVLDGLEGAAANTGSKFDRQSMDKMMSSLGGRVFLMNNVHDAEPTVFQTRWTLSYLRGPLNREDIRKLMGERKKTAGAKPAEQASAATSAQGFATTAAAPQSSSAAPTQSVEQPATATAVVVRPVLPPGVQEYFLPVRQTAPADANLRYKPFVIGVGNVRFVEPKAGVDNTLQYTLLSPFDPQSAQPLDWSKAEPARVWMEDLTKEPEDGCSFDALPAGLSDAKAYPTWTKQFTTWLYNSKQLKVFKSELTGDYSRPRETERDFRIRLTQSAREQRDEALQALKAKYGPKLATLQDKQRRAQQAVEKQQLELQQQQIQSAISIGTTVLGAFMGRKTISARTIDRATSAARSVGRSDKEQNDVGQAMETLQAVTEQLEQLNQKFAAESSALESKFDPSQVALSELAIAPKKTNISVPLLALAWAPYFTTKDGEIKAWQRPAGAST